MSDFITEKEMDSIRKVQLSDSQYKLRFKKGIETCRSSGHEFDMG
ncbi:hypothetical protein [Bacillus haynesii]|nr:hypothetical protein [Bacillus haynesii]